MSGPGRFRRSLGPATLAVYDGAVAKAREARTLASPVEVFAERGRYLLEWLRLRLDLEDEDG